MNKVTYRSLSLTNFIIWTSVMLNQCNYLQIAIS